MMERRRDEHDRHRWQLAAYLFFTITTAVLFGFVKSNNDDTDRLVGQVCRNQQQNSQAIHSLVDLATANTINPDSYPPGPIRDAMLRGKERAARLQAFADTLPRSDCQS